MQFHVPAYILSEPESCSLPTDEAHLILDAVTAAMFCTHDELPAVSQYGRRLPVVVQTMMLGIIARREGFDFVEQPSYIYWIDKNPELMAFINQKYYGPTHLLGDPA